MQAVFIRLVPWTGTLAIVIGFLPITAMAATNPARPSTYRDLGYDAGQPLPNPYYRETQIPVAPVTKSRVPPARPLRRRHNPPRR